MSKQRDDSDSPQKRGSSRARQRRSPRAAVASKAQKQTIQGIDGFGSPEIAFSTLNSFQRFRSKILVRKILSFAHDPLGFVLFVFPWGKEGTELSGEDGPREWQIEVLDYIGQQLRAGAKDLGEVIRVAVASGHGIGKSALVSWLILWALCTMWASRVVVSANTENQLRNKTWPELAKWHQLCMCREWFAYTATSLSSTLVDIEGNPMTKRWFAEAATWSRTNTEAFAGLHNKGRRILLLLDEASAIIDKVFEVAQGAMTDADTEIIWCIFGNPTRNSGAFYRAFNSDASHWRRWQIDSRTVKGTNLKEAQRFIEQEGEDSDAVRIRILGKFPRASMRQFISHELVKAAQQRYSSAATFPAAGIAMGVDVARHGLDSSVIVIRQGPKILKVIRLRIPDTMQLAARVAAEMQTWRPNAVCIDATGMGWGVYDRLRQLGHKNIYGIETGKTAENPVVYRRIKDELWGRMKVALSEQGLMLPPDDRELETELTVREYGYTDAQQIDLESKEDLKGRGEKSPDTADALALTYAVPIVVNNTRGQPAWLTRMQAARGAASNPMGAKSNANTRKLSGGAGELPALRKRGRSVVPLRIHPKSQRAGWNVPWRG